MMVKNIKLVCLREETYGKLTGCFEIFTKSWKTINEIILPTSLDMEASYGVKKWAEIIFIGEKVVERQIGFSRWENKVSRSRSELHVVTCSVDVY